MGKRTFGHLPTLDGLRALAILAVFISHSATQLFGESGVYEQQSLYTIASYGRLGVDLFFAISGFLITYRLLAELQQNNFISLQSFYIRRVFRIFPPYMMYLLVVILLGLSNIIRVDSWEIFSSLLFIRNYYMVWTVAGESTRHFWSLAVEEHFYLLWPALLIFLSPKRSLWFVPLIALLIHVWMAIDGRYHIFARFFHDAGSLFRTDTRIDALLWGCFAALIYPWAERCINRYSWLAGIFQVALPVALVAVFVLRIPLLHLWLSLIFPLIVIFTVAQPTNVIGKFLERPLLVWFGGMSYSLYIWQTLFLQIDGTSWSLAHNGAGSSKLFFWLIDLATILLVSSFSYYFIEKRMIALGRNLARKSSAFTS